MLKHKICAVTGVTGYLGAHIARKLEEKGWEVIELGRKSSSNTSRKFIYWSLRDPLEPNALEGVDILIHCAWDFFTDSLDKSLMTNVKGSIDLINHAVKVNIKVIFISTVSAFEGSNTVYGRSKLEVESFLLQQKGIVVRPALIWGASLGGMIESLSKVIKIAPVIPVPGAFQSFYTCHIDDLTSLIIFLCDYKPAPLEDMLITAASPVPISFLDLMKILSNRTRKKRIYLPIPWKPLYCLLKCLEYLGLHSRFSSDSLLSLMNMKKTIDLDWVETNKIFFRRFF